MKKIAKLLLLLLITFGITACFNDDYDDSPASTTSINDFVYRAMNIFYLYKDEVPDLVENKQNSPNYNTYLNLYNSPEDIFESLIFNRETVDRFSFILPDYFAFEQQQQGIVKSNGMEFGLMRFPEGSDDVVGYVRLILPNTSASSSTLQRGDLFYAINDTPLTVNNFRSLLSQDGYTVNLATYNDNGTPSGTDDTIDPNNENITLTKVQYVENPVFKTEILQVEGENVGYLMYNGFVSNFNQALNDAFTTFQANNIQHLVLDLRYNPGGSVNTATLLGSMVTGQFNGQTFTNLIYNSQLQSENTNFNYTNTFDNGAIASLNLNKVYVLATGSSASASELVINSLGAYIDVVHIGTETVGKSQASITLYDSSNYGRNNPNPSHTYAIQPLVAISVDKNNDVVPANGLTPDIEVAEQINNLGILGDENEPLLAEALATIAATNKMVPQKTGKAIKTIFDSNDLKQHAKDMYIDK